MGLACAVVQQGARGGGGPVLQRALAAVAQGALDFLGKRQRLHAVPNGR